jgi:GNAT superfamily N-acetyltransferase
MPQPVILEADLSDDVHARAVVALTAAYAEDPMGNAAPLPAEVLARLVPALRAHPTTLVFLAYVGDEPVGIATCFVGFSTFTARSLVNVHDLAVLPAHRGRGIGAALLRAVEDKARALGCARLTLEVLDGNARAQRVYANAGFVGGARFLTKPLLP